MATLKKCEECERPSNNQYFNCPPRMADGRHFTDYRPRCSQQYQDKITNKLMSSYEQRMFLTANADELIKMNAHNAYMMNRCGPCVEPYDQGTMVPDFEKQSCDSRTCSFSVNDPYGLGLGRKFYTEDQEQVFRKRFIEEKEKETTFFKQSAQCCGTVKDDVQYWPIDGVVNNEYNRNAVPSGGDPMSGGDLLSK
jgi:hypothetical protein